MREREHNTPFPVKIFVFDLQDKKQIREFNKDFGDDGARRWLSNLVLWACSNHCSVEVVKVCDVR
jgi:hypothetical protein